MYFSYFMHPLEAVQVRSVLSYVILLSDFLFSENVLKTTDLNKPIPAVNAMYKYLVDPKVPNSDLPAAVDDTKLEKLSKYLIRNSDLYGSEKGEILDPHFIKSLFDNIINSLVFEKYGNVYGFIAEVVLTSNYVTDEDIRKSLLEKLTQETYKNTDGSVSKLDKLSCVKIFQQYMLPLFPKSTNNTSIFSIDYVYAQAGSIFFRSLSNASVDPTTEGEFVDQLLNENKYFDEYIRAAHVVEQLVTADRIENSALRIFAFPALLHYVHEEKENLQDKSMADIINDQTQWQTACKYFFSNLSDFFQKVDEVQDKNYRYTFLQAINTYKNRSSLARTNLKRNCPSLNYEVEEKSLIDYLECTQDCFCICEGKRIELLSADTLFKEQFDNTVEKYARYERESLQNVFPDKIKKIMGNRRVDIKKGLFENYFIADLGPDMNNAKVKQSVPAQNDILQFYFPDTNQYAYYGLIRKDLEVFLINQTYDKEFKEKLGLYGSTYLLPWKFTVPLKSVHENFDDFLINITKERVNIFQRDLKEYKKEKQSWWKEFLYSLIPFYTCAHAVEDKNEDLAEMACSMDIIFLIPGAVEVSMALKELTAVSSEALAKISLSSIKAATSRLSLRATIRTGGRILFREGMKFVDSFIPQLFKKVGFASLRMFDPGFELLYSVGKRGLRSIARLVALTEKKYPGSFSRIKEILRNAFNRITTSTKEIYDKFASRNEKTYYNSLEENSGYGYKLIYSPTKRKFATLRTVEEFPYKVPVFSTGSDINEKTYSIIYKRKIKNNDEIYKIEGIDKLDNSHIYEVERKNVHLVHGSKLKLNEREFKIRFKNVHDKLPCSVGRFKRSPGEETLCFRTSLLEKRNVRVEEAVKIATKDGALTTQQVQNELRKYLFLEDSEKTELDFVTDWEKNNFLEAPEWSVQYKIDLPEVYSELRYNLRFEMTELEKEKWLEETDDYLFDEYETSKGNEHLSYEDFDNIQLYLGSFYREIDANTERGMAMRKSLYRLAIRQSDDPIEEYAKILYRGELRPNVDIHGLFYPIGKDFEFKKFTSTSSSDIVAADFHMSFSEEEAEVEYILEFEKDYLRVDVEKIFVYSSEKETILLPGSKFIIKDVKEGENSSGVKTVSVKMSYKHEPKLENIKRVMKELKKLKDLRA